MKTRDTSSFCSSDEEKLDHFRPGGLTALLLSAEQEKQAIALIDD
jgi:hypothetical protein